jgi:hypothetical protein
MNELSGYRNKLYAKRFRLVEKYNRLNGIKAKKHADVSV